MLVVLVLDEGATRLAPPALSAFLSDGSAVAPPVCVLAPPLDKDLPKEEAEGWCGGEEEAVATVRAPSTRRRPVRAREEEEEV